MTGITDLCHAETVRVAAAHQAEAEKIAAELAAIAATGMVLPGSITRRRTRCGRTGCGCHADPPRLHGPYWQWTRKIAAKTICRWLTADQHRDYTAWIDNDRRLRDLLARLEALGAAAFDADPRWERRPRTRPGQPPEPERQPPDSVGSPRLTCGRPSTQPSYAQLRAKREDLTRVVFTFHQCLCSRLGLTFWSRVVPVVRCRDLRACAGAWFCGWSCVGRAFACLWRLAGWW